LIVTALALSLPAAPSSAAAAVTGSVADPIGDSAEYAPDLGTTTVTVGDDETITVDTQVTPRPPAFWGGCAYYVVGTCIPSNMTVTWYFDYSSTSGDLSEGGADAKVVAVPARGQTFWESARWDPASGRFVSGAQPAVGAEPVTPEAAGDLRWTLRLADLGIPRPATLSFGVASLYKSYTGTGLLLNHADTAGPGSIVIPALAVAAPPPSADAPCKAALGRTNALQRKIRKARKEARHGGRSARRKLRRLKKRRGTLVKAMRRTCAAPIDAQPGNPPSSAPPGCKLETKPVLQQEGTGIYATWVYRSEVVVVCN
jgi:hypothetical protein